MKTNAITREQWLNNAIDKFVALFEKNGAKLEGGRVSCGWPSRSATSNKKQRIGEHWSPDASADQTSEIFISPVLDDYTKVMETLGHELVHRSVGNKCGHRGDFKRLATAIGLEGKMTATHAGEELCKQFEVWAEDLGDYPHAAITPDNSNKQTTRQRKMECLNCGFIARASRGAVEEHGLPVHCGMEMEMVE